MRTRTAFWLCLAAALAAGFFASGPVLYRTFIGLDSSAFPAGGVLDQVGRAFLPHVDFSASGLVLALLVLLSAGAATFFVVRGARRAAVDPARRRFLTGAASGVGAALVATVAGGALAFARAFLGLGNEGRGWREPASEIFGGDVVKTHPSWPDAWKGARVRAYRRLGRTGFEVSDISLGTGQIRGENGEAIVREAIARGVNYLDTAPDYSGSGSEQAIGRALRGQDRSKLFIATKFCTLTGHLPPGAPVARYQEVVEASLGRLGTDYVDLVHVHSCDELDRLMDPNLHEAFDRLREQGKARFLGFSSHTPNLTQVADRAIDSGRFDVMMLAYHHGIWPSLGELIGRARREQDMGVVAMKTLKGARHHGLAGFREHAPAYSQAAFRWVLSNPEVSCLVVSFFEPQHVDEYLFASGAAALGAQDVALLRRYDDLVAGSYCAPHCGACHEHCPEGLPIADVFRYRMYFEDYGQEKRGMASYARLAKNASVCVGCAAPCTGTCPVGIRIQERMLESHELLSLG
jgi:hypothetical protein